MSNKVGVFIDCAALGRGCQRQFQTNRVDFPKLLEQLKMFGDVTRAIAFVTHTSDGNVELQNKFNYLLSQSGYEVRTKISKRFEGSDEYRYVTWNVGMTLAIVDSMKDWEIAIIGSGDGCMMDVAKYLTKKHLSVYTAGFKRSTSLELVKFSERFIELNRSVVYAPGLHTELNHPV